MLGESGKEESLKMGEPGSNCNWPPLENAMENWEEIEIHWAEKHITGVSAAFCDGL